MERSLVRDISQEFISQYQPLQICEEPIKFKEFFYHSQARDISLEFKVLKKITETKKHVEMLVENLGDYLTLNRYPDILPYKDTIILPSNNSYINSSSVDGNGENGKAMFIATQGPMETTANSFWQLVWDYSIPLIIMGCNWVENSMDKCFPYFSADETLKTEDFEVQVLKTQEKYPFLTERILVLTNKTSLVSVSILHIQCTNWPDSSAPSIPESFQSICYLLERIEKRWMKRKTKIMVHCSAGVGRTGVLIAIYNLITEIKQEGTISIFKTVRLLREQRWGMVATEDQYIFIYKFMEFWISLYLTKINKIS